MQEELRCRPRGGYSSRSSYTRTTSVRSGPGSMFPSWVCICPRNHNLGCLTNRPLLQTCQRSVVDLFGSNFVELHRPHFSESNQLARFHLAKPFRPEAAHDEAMPEHVVKWDPVTYDFNVGVASRLEDNFECQLPDSRIARSPEGSESRSVKGSSTRTIGIAGGTGAKGINKVCVVEEIKKFRPELEIQTLLDRKCLVHSRVCVEHSRPAQRALGQTPVTA